MIIMAGNYESHNSPGDGWEIDENLDEVQTRKDVSAGRWLVRIASMEKKTTKSGDKDYFNLCFEILDCMKPEEEEFIGAKTWDIFNMNQAALWKLKALISACGYDATGSRVPNLTDCEVILDTYEEEYQGNRSIKTKRYKNPLKEGWHGIHETRDASTPAKNEDGGKLVSGNPASGKPASGKSAKAATRKDEDEIEI
jgi:hypothetical protein